MPSTDTIWSPARKPATRAGESASVGLQTDEAALAGCTQSDTEATVRFGLTTPNSMKTEPSRMTARKTFIIGPPAITMTFFHQAFL